MVSLACEGQRLLEPSRLDAPRTDGSSNYTVDALQNLRESLHADDAIFVLVGIDAFLELRSWRQPERLLSSADWIVVSRPGHLNTPEQFLPLGLTEDQRARVHLLKGIAEPESSTSIRARLAAVKTATRCWLRRCWTTSDHTTSTAPDATRPVSCTIESMASTEINQMLAAAVAACEDKKAEDIRILRLDPTESGLTDYFLICTGMSDRQNVAITDEIEARLKREFATYPNSVEGRRQGEWILMDYVDFIVHVFSVEKRAFYGLERLRKSATSLTIEDLDSEIKAAITASRNKPAPRKIAGKKVAAKKDLAKKPSGLKTSGAKARTSPAKKTSAKAAKDK